MSDSKLLQNEILARTDRIFDSQIKWRRHLHQFPELAMEEHKTTAYLSRLASEIGLKKLKLNMPTGLLLQTSGTPSKHIIAIRSDIDALPIEEKTKLAFRSRIKGRMHACGHDVHMATVMGAATILQQMKDRLPGSVRFLMQPAEEQPPGGARPMIADGALKNVSAILGLHVDPRVAVGRIGLRDGVTMASVYDFDLVIRGRTGHAARPHDAVDAITTAAEVIESIQKVVSREIDPICPVAISFGLIKGGTARNVVADEVIIAGTARTLSAATARKVPQRIKRCAQAVGRARGATVEVRPISSYPILSNNAGINSLFAESMKQIFGKNKVTRTEQVLGGEDFACYLEKIPGAMFRLGIRNNSIGANKSWHSDRFMVDEQAIKIGTALLVTTAFNFLHGKQP